MLTLALGCSFRVSTNTYKSGDDLVEIPVKKSKTTPANSIFCFQLRFLYLLLVSCWMLAIGLSKCALWNIASANGRAKHFGILISSPFNIQFPMKFNLSIFAASTE